MKGIKSITVALVTIAALVSPTLTFSQDNDAVITSEYKFWNHKKYMSIGLSSQKLENGSFRESATLGVNFNFIRTIYLHRNPVAGIFKIGIDWGIGVDYAKFSGKIDDDVYGYTGPFGYTGSAEDYDSSIDGGDEFDLGRHVVNLGINIGPSLTFRLFNNMRVKPYCYFTPSLSMYVNKQDASYSFVPFVTPGIAIGYKFINVGFQYKTGRGSYKELVADDEYGTEISYNMPKIKYRTNSYQFYLSFTF